MSIVQRTAVITGATSEKGIGVTTARRFAREGWGVVILDLDAEKSARVAQDIGQSAACRPSATRSTSRTRPR